MVRAAVLAAGVLAFAGLACAQKPESYLECKKRYPDAAMHRVGTKLLEEMVLKRSLPQMSELPKDKDADANVAILIDQHGSVVCAAGFSGELALVEAGVKAARQWKFKPFMLNGRPISVGANIYFHFAKGSLVAGFEPFEKN